MPDRTISILGATLSALIFSYLALMVFTVSLAAWRTDLASEVRDTENAIALLEHDYYEAIERIGRTNPASLGLGKPAAVTYAAMVAGPTVTRR
ncbi:MAG: hypothetical protein AAB892_00120 [Patescibacteria group bacterium]